MAPPPQPLPNDLIPDILLRLPPDDPAGLVRASAVCKAWRSIMADPAFHGQYRAMHPTAPVLGFLHRPRDKLLPRFVSTTSFCPAAADLRQCHPLDCRHGRAVFYDYGSLGGYVVWDPVTGELHKLPQEPSGEFLPSVAVVCAAGGGCDHRGCSGGPFIVAFVGLEHISEFDDDGDDDDEGDDDGPFVDAHACFYASDTGEIAWDMDIHVHLGQGRFDLADGPAALVGDSLYFLCRPRGILQYRYGLLQRLGGIMGMISAGLREGDILSMTKLPNLEHLSISKNTDVVLMEEGGGLGLAYLCPETRTMFYLLAREETEGTVGDNGWVQRRVIDLKTLLPVGNDPKWKPCLRGVSQEANVIFVSTDDGIFSIDLGSSLQVRKVCEMGIVHRWMHPFVSFYTESLLLKLASGKLPAPIGNK